MKKEVIVFILAASMLISSVCFAETQVTGVTTSFDPDSGRLVLQTQSRSATTVSIPQTVKVYLMTNTEAREGAEAWKILKDNLFKGTKVQLEMSERAVTAIRIVEVPM
jgi:hypothetical protein